MNEFRQRLSKILLLLSDITALLVAFGLSLLVRLHIDNSHLDVHQWWQSEGQLRAPIFGLVMLAGLARFGLSLSHYTSRKPFWDELRDILVTGLWLLVLDAALHYVAKLHFSRLAYLTLWASVLILLPMQRMVLKRWLLRIGYWQRPILLIGTANDCHNAWLALQSDRLLGYQLDTLLITDAAAPLHWAPANTRALPFSTGLDQQDLTSVCLPVLAMSGTDDLPARLPAVQQLLLHAPEYLVIPSLAGLSLHGLETQHVFSQDMLLLRASNRSAQTLPRLLKRTSDVIGAGVLLIVLSPLLITLAVCVRCSGGPALFWHTRLGQDLRPFPCPKFRTMVPDADAQLTELLNTQPGAREEWESAHKLKTDPRVTRLGAWLRKTSLDELPQLWSVLRGDMSLVGPRPVTADEIVRYGEQKRFYAMVRPGITGLWQVSGRSDTDYPSRVALDVWYVRNGSLWHDLVILMKTILIVLKREGAY